MIKTLCDKEKWSRLRQLEEYAPLREQLWEGYRMYCEGQEIPVIKFSDEMDFFKTGIRVNCEELWFQRRRQLTIYAILAMLYPEKEEYLEKLEDVIWAICDEFSWVLPAHRLANWLNKRDGIDLFAAETGLYLVEIKHMLAGRLSPVIAERITREVKMRIIDSFEREQSWFETLSNNWATVCGGNVGAVLIYECPEKFLKQESRIYKCTQNYLSGMCDDGGTCEGADYWIYGFSFYVLFEDILRRHTYGRENYFNDEKVKKIAGFFSSCYLDANNIATFSDCGESVKYPFGIIHFLKNEYDIEMPSLADGSLCFDKFSWTVRSFLYYDAEYTKDSVGQGKSYYEELEWYIERKKKYGFAVKGGHNGEFHNHNDIGSFIITDTKKQILCDLGSPEYTGEVFGKNRYKILNNSSLGHSVPIVNGCAQKEGAEYKGKLSVSGNVISVDMTEAYPVSLGHLIRTFELSDDAVVLCDSFDSDKNIIERFVSETEPEIKENEIVIDGTRLVFSPGWYAEVSFEDIKAHDGRRMRRVYLIDMKTDGKADEFRLEIIPEQRQKKCIADL